VFAIENITKKEHIVNSKCKANIAFHIWALQYQEGLVTLKDKLKTVLTLS